MPERRLLGWSSEQTQSESLNFEGVMPDDCGLFGGEVVEKSPGRDVCCRGDRLDRDVCETSFGDETERCGSDRVPRRTTG